MAEILVFLNSIASVFSNGTYPFRFFLLLAYAGSILCLGMLAYRSRIAHVFSRDGRPYRSLALISIGSFLSIFLITLACQLLVFQAHGIPQRSLALFFEGEEITGTRLAHMHFGKTGLARVPASEGFVMAADTGGALIPYIPPFVPLTVLALFLVALVTSVLLAPSLAASVRGRKRRASLLLLHGMLAFILLEKALDGGILSDGALLALAGYGALLLAPREAFFRIVMAAAALQALILASLFAGGFYWPLAVAEEAFARSGLLLCMIVALSEYSQGSRLRALLAGALAVPGCLAFIYMQALPERAYLASEIPETGFVAAFPWEGETPLPVAGTVGRLVVHETSSLIGGTVGEAIDQYRLPYWYRPVSAAVPLCSGLERRIARRQFTVLSAHALEAAPADSSSLARIVLEPRGRAPSGWFRYEGTLSLDSCIERRVDVVREMLRLSGADEFIMYGLSSGDSGRAATGSEVP